jgi:PTS system nitrogen regulatory IIA component
MDTETMDLDQVAAYLQLDKRAVSKMADRGRLPARKVAGEWRFARAEINHWIETKLPDFSEEQLTALEAQDTSAALSEPLISGLLTTEVIAVPLPAATRASVLKELVSLADRSGKVYDSAAILDAVRQREDLATTALDCGIAIPHPRRPLQAALADSVLAYGRTASGVPFGAPYGRLTDIFFLVCCRDEGTHLRVLARLSRLLLRPGFVDQIRAAETVDDTRQAIESAECDLPTP